MPEMIRCHYHPSRLAQKKCEQCNVFVCIEDIKKYRKDQGDSWITLDLCVPCYHDTIKKERATWRRFLPLALVIGFSVFFFITWNFLGMMSREMEFEVASVFLPTFMNLGGLAAVVILIIALVLALYHAFIDSPRKWKEAYIEKEEFLATVEEQ